VPFAFSRERFDWFKHKTHGKTCQTVEPMMSKKAHSWIEAERIESNALKQERKCKPRRRSRGYVVIYFSRQH
jgi:hypothetical protein